MSVFFLSPNGTACCNRRLQNYEFISKVSEGAYGVVWKARNKRDGGLVAVKKLKDAPKTMDVGEMRTNCLAGYT